MNQIATIASETLPSLIDRAASALSSARSSAEVLEARDMARVAYDASKSAGRMARAKQAHDEVIAAVYRSQADSAVIEARAKVRLADEYDAAQDRGEVAGHGRSKVELANVTTVADLGLRRDEIHEARQLRNAEVAEPGKIEAAAAALISRGEEPTKAALRREIVGGKPAAEPIDPEIAKLRREVGKLTAEAMIDEIIGLRAELSDAKKQRAADKAEIHRLKETIKLFDGDKDRVIKSLNKTIEHKNSEMFRANASVQAELRKNFALEKRIKELETMGVVRL